MVWCRYRLLRYAVDDVDGPVGALPVLFLHGSSGHYHQARSLFARLDLLHSALRTPQAQRPDYFSIDFVEEKSAFSGALLLRQAHYTNEVLRTLAHRYQQAAHAEQWRGAVVVAHSMGGVVAHLLPLLCNHLNGSVLAMYTLGTPHAAPVLVVDELMREVYRALAEERRKGRPGPGPVLLSLSGGVNDFFIEPALSLLPSPSTINSVAHAVPHVQTAVEHQSLCWCRQLMETLAHSITLLHTPSSPLPTAHSLFLNPIHLTLAPVHRAVAQGSLSMQAVEVAVSGKGLIVHLPVSSSSAVLVLVEGKVVAASMCGVEGSGRPCVDVGGAMRPTSVLYRDEAYPPSSHSPSARHLLYLPAVSLAASALHLHSSPDASEYPLTLPAVTFPPRSTAPLRSSPLPPGVYHWAAHVPSGVDRYYTLTVNASSSPPPSIFFHFSSVPVDDAAAQGREIAEDWFTSDLHCSTVVRFYRRPYDRWVTAVLVVGGADDATVLVELSFSPYSYLRTLFLQLPLLPHFLLSAFLLLLALQHRHLRVYGAFPHLPHLFVSLLHRPLVAVVSLASLSVLFIAAFPGTQFHAEAFLSPSALSSAPSYSLLSLLLESSLWTRLNRNETGLAGLVLLVASLLLLAALQGLLLLLLSAMAVVIAALRRLLSLCPCSAHPSLAAAMARLLCCLLAMLALLCHLDQTLLVHFGLSLSSSLSAVLDALILTPLLHLRALFIDPDPAGSDVAFDPPPSLLAAIVPSLSVSGHVVLITALYLVVQAVRWDVSASSQTAYQLSCSSLALLAASLSIPHLLTSSAFPTGAGAGVAPLLSFPSLSPLVTIPALQLLLAFASTAPPVDSPLLQPLIFLLYSASLLFISDASMALQSFSFIYTVLLLCLLPHAIHRCVVVVLDALWSVDMARRAANRTHVE